MALSRFSPESGPTGVEPIVQPGDEAEREIEGPTEQRHGAEEGPDGKATRAGDDAADPTEEAHEFLGLRNAAGCRLPDDAEVRAWIPILGAAE